LEVRLHVVNTLWVGMARTAVVGLSTLHAAVTVEVNAMGHSEALSGKVAIHSVSGLVANFDNTSPIVAPSSFV
jgi:hypothetical protein